jgi:hypothetical protein
VFIRYHKRERCGKYDRQQAEILGENETPNGQFLREPLARRQATEVTVNAS